MVELEYMELKSFTNQFTSCIGIIQSFIGWNSCCLQNRINKIDRLP